MNDGGGGIWTLAYVQPVTSSGSLNKLNTSALFFLLRSAAVNNWPMLLLGSNQFAFWKDRWCRKYSRNLYNSEYTCFRLQALCFSLISLIKSLSWLWRLQASIEVATRCPGEVYAILLCYFLTTHLLLYRRAHPFNLAIFS